MTRSFIRLTTVSEHLSGRNQTPFLEESFVSSIIFSPLQPAFASLMKQCTEVQICINTNGALGCHAVWDPVPTCGFYIQNGIDIPSITIGNVIIRAGSSKQFSLL